MVFSHKCGLNTRYVLSTVYVKRIRNGTFGEFLTVTQPIFVKVNLCFGVLPFIPSYEMN